MIIYKDIVTDDELLSDTFKIIDVGDGLWEVDLRMITKGAENFQLEGANPSAEGEDADEGGEAATERVLDIQDQFRLNAIEAKPSKKEFQGIIKSYMKKVLASLKERGESEENIKAFTTGAQSAAKKIFAAYDDYDLFLGESMNPDGMYILVNYRDDGITPFATIWKWGLTEYKV